MTSADTNKVIQGLWIGEALSPVENLCITSFLRNGHDFHLYTYGEVRNVPPGATILDGREILAEEEVFTYNEGWGKGSPAAFANLFRYALLRQRGGWWVDMDVVCLRPFDIPAGTVLSTSEEGKWGTLANNCVMKVPPGHRLAAWLEDRCRERDLSKVRYGEIGPQLLQAGVKELRLEGDLAPPSWFCPVTWRHVTRVIAFPRRGLDRRLYEGLKQLYRALVRGERPPGSRISGEAYAVHLWNEIWRQNGLDKNGRFDRRCLYERLRRRYGV